MPQIQTSIPAILKAGIFSFKNILARITDIIGEEQVPRMAILIAVE